MSPTIAECLSMPANVSGTPLERTMKGTANSSFGRRSSGRNWPLRKRWKFGPLRERLRKSLSRAAQLGQHGLQQTELVVAPFSNSGSL